MNMIYNLTCQNVNLLNMDVVPTAHFTLMATLLVLALTRLWLKMCHDFIWHVNALSANFGCSFCTNYAT